MDTEPIEYLLLSYFNEVIWVDKNPAQFTISETFKENGIVRSSTKEEFIHLQDLLVSSLEDINKFLFELILDCNSIDLNFYPKNMITKLFNIKFILMSATLPKLGDLQVLEKDPPSLRSLNSQVPCELEWICLKCLEKQAADRYATAAELVADLDRFLRKEPPLAGAGSLGQKLRRWGRREPVLVAHLGGLLSILLLVQGIFAAHTGRDVEYTLRVCGL